MIKLMNLIELWHNMRSVRIESDEWSRGNISYMQASSSVHRHYQRALCEGDALTVHTLGFLFCLAGAMGAVAFIHLTLCKLLNFTELMHLLFV